MSNDPDLGWGVTEPTAQTPFEIDSSGILAQDAAFAPDFAMMGEGALGFGPAAVGAAIMGANIYAEGAQFGMWGHHERPSTMLPQPGSQTPAPPYSMQSTNLRPGLRPGYENDPQGLNTFGPTDSGAP